MSISIEGSDVDLFLTSAMSTEYQVGQTVALTKNREGIIRYAGLVHFSDGFFYGIELTDGSAGKHNGTVYGTTYFVGRPNRCIFVNKDAVLGESTGKPQHKRARPRTFSTPALPMMPPVTQNREKIARAPSSARRLSEITPSPAGKSRKSVTLRRTNTSNSILTSSVRVEKVKRPNGRKRSQSVATPTLGRRSSKFIAARGSWRDTEMLKDKPMHMLSRHKDSRLNAKQKRPSQSKLRKGSVQGQVSGLNFEFDGDRLRPWKSMGSIERPSRSPSSESDSSFTAPAHWTSAPDVVEPNGRRESEDEIEILDGDEEENDVRPERDGISSDADELEKWMKSQKIWLPELHDCLTALEVSDPQYLDLLSPDEIVEVIEDVKLRIRKVNPSAAGNSSNILDRFQEIHNEMCV